MALVFLRCGSGCCGYSNFYATFAQQSKELHLLAYLTAIYHTVLIHEDSAAACTHYFP